MPRNEPYASRQASIAATDVHYADEVAGAACILFDDWAAASPSREFVVQVPVPAPYVPGRFFERELPCLRAVLERLDDLPDVILVDGFVWLDGLGTPGLGAHLWQSLGNRCAVIGVAKSRHPWGLEAAQAVTRGRGHRPLYVSAVGMELEEAARCVRGMHGQFRIPTLLKHVDHLARSVELRQGHSGFCTASPSVLAGFRRLAARPAPGYGHRRCPRPKPR